VLSSQRTHRVVAAVVGLVAAAALFGCAGTDLPKVRYLNQPPVRAVNDRKHVPEAPDENRFFVLLYRLDVIVYEPLLRFFAGNQGGRARSANSVGDVPNSTWFTDRGRLDPDVIRRGPGAGEGPVKPWTITGSKVGGAQLGLRLKDKNGDNYLLKFDKKGYPEYETGAAVIVQRLLWALGYNVPEDNIALFGADDLIIGEDATIEDKFGGEQPLAPDVLRSYLDQVDRRPDGQYRGFVSKYIDGVPIGGIEPAGVRKDDPNDVIPHEHRRELRALGLVYGWLQATDHKVDNSLDMYVEDPEVPGHKYVRHYFLDFGNSLGVNGYRKARPGDGHMHQVDFRWGLTSLVTFGLYKRPWEGQVGPRIPGVGDFDLGHYQPESFRGQLPYASFKFADRFDNYWAAKRIVALSREQLRAAVDAGRLSDERARDYLVDTLHARARKAARYWFSKVSPIDDVEVEQGALCFSDLWIANELGGEPANYELAAFDYEGAATGWTGRAAASASGRVCVSDIGYATTNEGYTIVSVRVIRGQEALPTAYVHVATGSDGRRVIGLWRE